MIIGIAGASRSGKTTLAQMIANNLPPGDCHTIQQDEYCCAHDQLPRIANEPDWEHPNGLDYERLKRAIITSKSKYIIVEGFLVFYDDTLLTLFDKTIFIDIDKATFLERKQRDKRWGEIPEWYINHIWESYLRFGKRNSENADITINADRLTENEVIVLKNLQIPIQNHTS